MMQMQSHFADASVNVNSCFWSWLTASQSLRTTWHYDHLARFSQISHRSPIPYRYTFPWTGSAFFCSHYTGYWWQYCSEYTKRGGNQIGARCFSVIGSDLVRAGIAKHMFTLRHCKAHVYTGHWGITQEVNHLRSREMKVLKPNTVFIFSLTLLFAAYRTPNIQHSTPLQECHRFYEQNVKQTAHSFWKKYYPLSVLVGCNGRTSRRY